ncbi:MAG: M20/M25/M40 family metallo-hydrolase [Nannocystaceae bacterium]|nr:M20/M25/M40 family metallo-hydrolase [bacterium]
MRRSWIWGLLLCACRAAAPAKAPRASADFDPARLLAEAAALLRVPRTLGDPNRERGIAALRDRLEAMGATVHTQPFTGYDPDGGAPFALTNVYGVIRPKAPRQFVLATHFDIRPWAESDPDPRRHDQPIPGANDGTSGVAVLFALLPALRDSLDPGTGFTIALFDGEELGRPGHGGYCAGSMYFAEHVEEAPPSMARAEFGIVLDMVGDAELTIAREPNSSRHNPALVQRLWETAAALGERAFVDATYPHAITDDHVFLTRAGIPSVLLIDYDYDAWHTHADDLDRISGQSMATVARVVFETLTQ